MQAPTDEAILRAPSASVSANCLNSDGILAGTCEVEAGSTSRDHGRDYGLACFAGPDPGRDGQLRLEDGGSGDGYAYARLEVFLRGFWGNVCNAVPPRAFSTLGVRFTPDSLQVACSLALMAALP
eukprot:jgi/Ulvmu1/8836/UM049_0016.1